MCPHTQHPSPPQDLTMWEHHDIVLSVVPNRTAFSPLSNSVGPDFGICCDVRFNHQFSLQNAVCRKLLLCCGCMLFFLIVTRSLPISRNVDPHFVSHAPFLTRLAYAFFSIQAARPKFYFAWTLGESCVCVCVLGCYDVWWVTAFVKTFLSMFLFI